MRTRDSDAGDAGTAPRAALPAAPPAEPTGAPFAQFVPAVGPVAPAAPRAALPAAAPAALPAGQSQPAETARPPRWNDPHDSTETALLTKIPSGIGTGGKRGDRDEKDGPEAVAVRRDREKAPKQSGRERRRQRLSALRSMWPLLPILIVQGAFAWRLLVTNTAFLDEATYMWSGRVIAENWLHGKGSPEFQTFFSGAPVIYPVLAAVASKIGGLIAARALSLLFMLLATTAVYLSGRRLHGGLTGFFAAGLFAALGPTLHLSSYATFDAMALCLLAWSTYFTIRFAYGDSRNALLYGAALMVLADCTKYACLLWNPVIVLLAATAGPGYSAWKCSRSWNLQRFGMVFGTMLALAVILGRKPYFDGFDHTTLRRAASDSTISSIISHLEQWIGPLLALGVLGIIVILWQWRRKTLTNAETLTMALLLLGGVLAPVNQLRIHTLLSLEKHADIGMTFAAIPAGYLLARIVDLLGGAGRENMRPTVRRALVAVVVAAVALVPFNVDGNTVGTRLHSTWPSSTPLIAALKPLLHKGNDNYLVEDYDVPAYYLPNINWWQWHDTVAGSYTDPTTHISYSGAAALQEEILAHHYKVIVLDYAESPTTDKAIAGTIVKAGYKKVAKIVTTSGSGKGTYNIWTAP